MKNIVQFLCKLLLLLACLFTASSLFANTTEEKFVSAGLVDVNMIDKTIKVDLVNSDPEKNLFETGFYDGLTKAYLRKEIAVMLAKAQAILKKEHPTYSLQVLDAARPRSVSRAMYEKMKGTRFENYVANPDTGSIHNYGIAVDITLVDESGNKLDMGPSPFYSSYSKIYWHYFLKKIGIEILPKQQKNRDLLKHVMLKAGFYPLSHEWWHFNGMKKTDARSAYSIIE